jgi:hypothetical protein
MKDEYLYPILEEARQKASANNTFDIDVFHRTLADLTIERCIDELRKEWYRVNNAPYEKDARSIGIHVGSKSSLIKAMDKLSKLRITTCVYCNDNMPYYDQGCITCIKRM